MNGQLIALLDHHAGKRPYTPVMTGIGEGRRGTRVKIVLATLVICIVLAIITA